MIVVCISNQLTAEQRRDLGYRDSASIFYQLTAGQEYPVLGVSLLTSAPINRGANFMVEDDIGRCAFAPMCLFEIVSPSVSKLWKVERTDGLDLLLWPNEFLVEFFHDDLSDGEPQAASVFRAVCDQIKAEARRDRLKVV